MRKSGVPILSDIPGLGLLFSSTNDNEDGIVGADYAAHLSAVGAMRRP
jgi:hypothetical protein